MQNPLVIFADFDDTLLADHRSGDSPDSPIDACLSNDILLVLCSRRTRVELEHERERLGFSGPFISECGAALFAPLAWDWFDPACEAAEYRAIEFGPGYRQVVSALYQLALVHSSDVIGFTDMSVDEIAGEFGISPLHAQLAKLREYSEPFRFVAGDPARGQRLLAALRARGIGTSFHGRYVYAGAPVSYDAGMKALVGRIERAFGPTITAAFGDNVNDSALLKAVDLPIIVGHVETPPAAALHRDVPTAHIAPLDSFQDWMEMMLEVGEAWAGRRRWCWR